MEMLTENAFGIVGLVVGIVGMVIGFFFWLRPREVQKILRCEFSFDNLINESQLTHPDISVRFKGYGNEVKTLSLTKVIIWSQNALIEKSSIAKASPLRLVANDAEILSASVVKESSNVNGFEIQRSQDRKSLAISFDHLNPRDGLQIQILHTGKERGTIKMAGRLKGGKIMAMRRIENTHYHDVPSLGCLFLLVAVTGAISLIEFLFGFFNVSLSDNPSITPDHVIPSKIAFVFTLVTFFFVWGLRKTQSHLDPPLDIE